MAGLRGAWRQTILVHYELKKLLSPISNIEYFANKGCVHTLDTLYVYATVLQHCAVIVFQCTNETRHIEGGVGRPGRVCMSTGLFDVTRRPIFVSLSLPPLSLLHNVCM